MSFYKIIGALLLTLGGLLFARRKNRLLAEELLTARAWCSFLEYVRNSVDCFSLPLSEIFARCDRELLVRCGYRKEELPASLAQLVEACGISDCETEKLLLEFASEFGRCYREEQTARCKYFSDALERRCAALGEQIPKRQRLNTTLCLSASLALAIFFI